MAGLITSSETYCRKKLGIKTREFNAYDLSLAEQVIKEEAKNLQVVFIENSGQSYPGHD